MIQHVMARYCEGQSTAKEHVTFRDTGVFTVTTSKDKSVLYTMCFKWQWQCDCLDWRRHYLPCKHFCAIFRLYDEYSWDFLLVTYRDSPVFRLDEDIVGSCDSAVGNAPEFQDDVSDSTCKQMDSCEHQEPVQQ